jgi:hypothetical protein
VRSVKSVVFHLARDDRSSRSRTTDFTDFTYRGLGRSRAIQVAPPAGGRTKI